VDPEIPEKLQEAVDAAIEQATPEPLEVADDDDTPDETAQDDKAGTGDDAGDTPGAGSEDPAKAKPSGDGAEGEDRPGADDGKAKPDGTAVDDKKPAATEDKKPEVDPATGKPRVEPKAKDPVNDPIPPTLKAETKERMTSLITTVKTATKERDDAVQQTQEFFQAIAATGADPETFGRHVEVLRLMNSEDPAEQRQAVKLLRAAADKVALETGETPTGMDPLEGHDDLKEDVENGDISRERAVELATSRNRAKAEETRRTKSSELTTEQQQRKEEIDAAGAAMNELEQQLIKSDPNYYAKRDLIQKTLTAVVNELHPSRWLGAYKRVYESLKDTPLPRRNGAAGDGVQRVPRGTGGQQPQRGRQGAGGGGIPEPKSIAEAIDFGLAQANRR
jgi:hypothetical protein